MKIFFAYAGHPQLRAETMRQSIGKLVERGVDAKGWESLEVAGGIIIQRIKAAIDEADVVVVELSSMNDNVLFEFGYALAKRKSVVIAFDESDRTANELWRVFPILKTVGRVDYEGNANQLSGRLLDVVHGELPTLYEGLLADARPREANAVFSAQSPVKHTAAETLENYLQRQTSIKVLGASDDMIVAPLEFYTKEIYRSSAAIFHLLGTRRRDSSHHNSIASLLAGFAHGLEIPVLMAVEAGYSSPIDYSDMLFEYQTSSELQGKVDAWLQSIPKPVGTNRRLGRLDLDIELPIRSFGQYVAEYEADELSTYYIQTSEFAKVVTGEARIFSGRKGTGKSATMNQVQSELYLDRGILVVPIRPTAFELGGLAELVASKTAGHQSEYFMTMLWTYLIYSEIALTALLTEKSKPRSEALGGPLNDLEDLISHLSIDVDGDFSSRIRAAIAKVEGSSIDGGRARGLDEIARGLRIDGLTKLVDVTTKVLSGYNRVAVLIDNLDKNWEPGETKSSVSKLILSLLVASGKIEKEIGNRGNRDLTCTVGLFLRTDIMDSVKEDAREPDKIGYRTVDWNDDQLLVRVLEERYAVNSGQPPEQMWAELFTPEVRGLPTREYYLWRVLRRPRDFIYMANSSLTTAINRKHRIIEPGDILHAEKEYSKFAVEALVVESDSADLELEEVLYEFAGLDSTIAHEDIVELLAEYDQKSNLIPWLMASSFLGVETAEDRFEYVEGASEARRKHRVAERYCKNRDRSLRFRVHPAFRPFLEVRDDDLHL